MIRMTGNIWSLMVIIAFSIFMAFNVIDLAFYASKILPIIFSTIVFILSVIALIREVRESTSHRGGQVERQSNSEEAVELKKYVPIALWLLSYFLGIYLVGFMIATPLFLAGYMKAYGSTWKGAIITTVVFTLLFYGVFIYLLQVNLHQGLLATLIDL